MPNTQNINDVIEFIKAHPKNFKMDAFITGGKDLHSCGTAGCIAGFTLALKTNLLEKPFDFKPSIGDVKPSFRLNPDRLKESADILGIERRDASTLFFMPGGDAQRELFDMETPEDRAKAAVRVLEILRDTGEVNWRLALHETGLHDVEHAPDSDDDYDDEDEGFY